MDFKKINEQIESLREKSFSDAVIEMEKILRIFSAELEKIRKDVEALKNGKI